MRVDGLDKLAAKLDALPADMRRGAEAGVAATVGAVADLMRDAAPVDTGELRDSIVAESEGLSGTARATARHATFVNFGTSRTPAVPFASAAGEQGRKILPDEVTRHVREELPT